MNCVYYTLLIGTIEMKEYHSSSDTALHVILPVVPDGMPAVIHPEGLPLKRQKYLAKEIREFCTPQTRDIVCPFPEGKFIRCFESVRQLMCMKT